MSLIWEDGRRPLIYHLISQLWAAMISWTLLTTSINDWPINPDYSSDWRFRTGWTFTKTHKSNTSFDFCLNSAFSYLTTFYCYLLTFFLWCRIFPLWLFLRFPKWPFFFHSCFSCLPADAEKLGRAADLFPGGTGLCAGFTRCLVATQDSQVWCYSLPMLMFIQEGPLLPEQREGAGQLWKHC